MSKKFKIPPSLMGRERLEDEQYMEVYDAARKHGKLLDKAHDQLMVAWDTAMVLRGYLNETHIAECMRAATLVEQMEKLIEKAYALVDQHGTQHTNLFIAYFDLKGGAL